MHRVKSKPNLTKPFSPEGFFCIFIGSKPFNVKSSFAHPPALPLCCFWAVYLLGAKRRLKSELEARNRKLSAKALYLSGRNQMIEEVLSDLTQRPELSTALRFTH